MTVEELLEKYKKKYPNIPWEIGEDFENIISKKNGKLHSYNDAPSSIYIDIWSEIGKVTDKYWHKEGKIHRGNGKPAIISKDGTKYYYINGKEYDPTNHPEFIKKQINKLTVGKSSKQKTKEDLLKEFVVEVLST